MSKRICYIWYYAIMIAEKRLQYLLKQGSAWLDCRVLVEMNLPIVNTDIAVTCEVIQHEHKKGQERQHIVRCQKYGQERQLLLFVPLPMNSFRTKWTLTKLPGGQYIGNLQRNEDGQNEIIGSNLLSNHDQQEVYVPYMSLIGTYHQQSENKHQGEWHKNG